MYHLKKLAPKRFFIIFSLLSALALVLHGLCKEVRKPYNRNVVGRHFYYWRTSWSLSDYEKMRLNEFRVKLMYVRFFDVGWDEPSHAPVPIAPIQWLGPWPEKIDLVPVVYIKNKVFTYLKHTELDQFAKNIYRKIKRTLPAKTFIINEVQIDCDWSESTRAQYFRFLQSLQNQMKVENIILSTTIRLHQVKYLAEVGVPPVQRAMLMFYNMGRLSADSNESNNSIFNVLDTEKYTKYIKTYPIYLDVVLPIFSWTIHVRGGRIQGLVDKWSTEEMDRENDLRPLNARLYEALQPFFFRGIYFKKGDMLKVEKIRVQDTVRAAQLLSQSQWQMPKDSRLAFFDFDERNLRHYETSSLDQIQSLFYPSSAR